MSPPIQPIYLLADSQLLFWRGEGEGFLEAVRRQVEADGPKAAYIGASNRDNPEYYEIFEAAMEGVGITERRHIPARPSAMDEIFLGNAHLILLAGGDVALGWSVLTTTGMRETILQRYYSGAVLMGVSAGAVQLGLSAEGERDDEPLDLFKLIPAIIDVHDEGDDWSRLRRLVRRAGSGIRGIGIPSGGGLIYHPDHTLEPIRHSAVELALKADEVAVSLLLPGAPTEMAGASGADEESAEPSRSDGAEPAGTPS